MEPESSLLERLKALIGQEMVATAPEEIGRAGIRQFAMAIGDTNAIYSDEAYAGTTQYGGIIAPPTMVCETVQYLVGDVDETGGPARRLGLQTGMEVRGGNDYEFVQPLRPDDIITAHWKVTDVAEKRGKTGRLFFLNYQIRYTNQRSELLAINNEWLVFRDPPSK